MTACQSVQGSVEEVRSKGKTCDVVHQTHNPHQLHSARFYGERECVLLVYHACLVSTSPHVRVLTRRNFAELTYINCTETWARQWLGLYYIWRRRFSFVTIFKHIPFRKNIIKFEVLEDGTCHFITRMGLPRNMCIVTQRLGNHVHQSVCASTLHVPDNSAWNLQTDLFDVSHMVDVSM